MDTLAWEMQGTGRRGNPVAVAAGTGMGVEVVHTALLIEIQARKACVATQVAALAEPVLETKTVCTCVSEASVVCQDKQMHMATCSDVVCRSLMASVAALALWLSQLLVLTQS